MPNKKCFANNYYLKVFYLTSCFYPYYVYFLTIARAQASQRLTDLFDAVVAVWVLVLCFSRDNWVVGVVLLKAADVFFQMMKVWE